MMTIDGVEMVDVLEAARLTGRSAETVRRWVWSGRVQAVKRGNKLYLARADVPAERADASRPSGDEEFAAWARRVLEHADRGTPNRQSAADLVLEDRAVRAGR